MYVLTGNVLSLILILITAQINGMHDVMIDLTSNAACDTWASHLV